MPTNFKSYESQVRLLAAVIATSNPKLDYTALAKHMGSDVTPSALDHRLRPIKQLARLQAAYVNQGKDPKDLPLEQEVIKRMINLKGDLPEDGAAIQRLFGESTPAGLEYQFRDIKALGKAQKAAADKGENPAEVQVPGIGGTPRAHRRANGSAPSSARKTASVSKRGKGRKRSAEASDNESDDSDYSAKDVPVSSKKQRTVNGNGISAAIESAQNGSIKFEGVRRSLFGNGVAAQHDDELQEIDGTEFNSRAPRVKMEQRPALSFASVAPADELGDGEC